MPDFSEDQLREIMKKMTQGGTEEKPKDTESPTERPMADDDIAFGERKAAEELEIICQAWREFQEKVKDLAIINVIVPQVRDFGEGLVQIELAVKGVVSGQPQRVLERYILKSRILAAELNKYRG
jgi:hypothetical protein